jgi:hypothetical protein
MTVLFLKESFFGLSFQVYLLQISVVLFFLFYSFTVS